MTSGARYQRVATYSGRVRTRLGERTRTKGFGRNRTCHKGLGIVCGTWGRLGGPSETEIAELRRTNEVPGVPDEGEKDGP